MILIIYILLIGISIYITKLKYGEMLRPNTVFTVIWCACGILAMYNNLELVKPGWKIHLYNIVSVVIFNFIYIIFIRMNKTNSTIVRGSSHLGINYRLILSTIVIAIVLISPNVIIGFQTLLSSNWNFSEVRLNYANMNLSGRYFYTFFTNNIPNSIIEAASVLTAIDLSNRKYKLLPWVIVGILINTIAFGGRSQILDFLIFYVAAFLINNKYQKVKLNKLLVALGIVTLVVLTLSRGTSGMSVLDMGIYYFAGSFSYFQVILNNPLTFGLNGSLLYGYLTFGFLIEPLILALKFFLKLNIDVPSYYFNIYAQRFVNIGYTTSRYFNNNTTMYYTFLRDFGKYGFIIGTIILAAILCLLQRKHEKLSSLRNSALLVYFYAIIIHSVMAYTLTSVSSSLTLIFLIFLSKSNKFVLKDKGIEIIK